MAELFSGHSEHTLDAKGRVIVPAKYRSYFADGGRLGVGTNRSLALWTHSSYEQQATAWVERVASGEASEEDMQFWAANIEDVTVDASTGRLLVPGYMREHARIEPGDRVRLAGALTHIAVWNADIYNERIHAPSSPKFTKDPA